ncbi:MAG: FixH family protein [Rickettsiales bacterium]|nr:FixH family protein [Rickettsiales bacterium]
MHDTRQDRWIPWYFVLFFAVIFAVDGTMVTLALRTHTGLVTDHPYEKGLAYNRVVEAYAKQAELGWQGTIILESGEITFTLRDAAGHIVKADRVTAKFTRPTQSGMDTTIPLTPSAESWKAALTLPAPGLWEMHVFAVRGTQEYQQTKRVVIP